MKILSNKKQKELFEKIKELDSIIVKTDIDLKAFELLADIGCSVLDMKYLYKMKEYIENE